MLRGNLLYPSKRNKSRIEFFVGKTFLGILQNDKLLLLSLIYSVARVVMIAKVIAEVIHYLKVGSILCNGLDTPAIMHLK